MTPKEKAEELVYKFCTFPQLDWTDAKQCALIAVDEIIESRKDDAQFDDALLSTSSGYYTAHPMYKTYWMQVKQQLEKL